MEDDQNMLQHPDALTRLRYVVHRLRAPGGCPWDMEQTHQTLIPHVIEEAYEVAEAIRSGDPAQICDELGDLLLQPILHAEIASETGAFDLDQMAHGLTEKLIRRHPHVFGTANAATSDAVLTQWDAIKRIEKGTQHEGMLHGTGSGLPALMRGQKLQKKAARVGFDWPDAKPVIDKIREETTELEEAIQSGNAAHIEEEIGDLFFSVVNLARKLGIESESALAAANDKFTRRFHAMEMHLREKGRELGQLSLTEMDEAWDAVKSSE
ncbi:MAG: nucleoside triphosphate pyrophosphohydrolase [Verrucomicrobiaceae bacterium]|nr:nucleoside triphosphate pyrophosphohydrolase [Verrucomicrobiaceae bacterium]